MTPSQPAIVGTIAVGPGLLFTASSVSVTGAWPCDRVTPDPGCSLPRWARSPQPSSLAAGGAERFRVTCIPLVGVAALVVQFAINHAALAAWPSIAKPQARGIAFTPHRAAGEFSRKHTTGE